MVGKILKKHKKVIARHISVLKMNERCPKKNIFFEDMTSLGRKVNLACLDNTGDECFYEKMIVKYYDEENYLHVKLICDMDNNCDMQVTPDQIFEIGCVFVIEDNVESKRFTK